ncbi:hypothetical protein O6H91_16G062500 [Diphasiastrum complanatum]|uniref:Uncharacterized protein n=1 Tax=Diphasiastrum complanatum TaxID=34168 RepID=A0ACC2BCV7_DIPCM|nr:hypothetical protein O6H91_16G062500 [Diphasiastrum complanatum]
MHCRCICGALCNESQQRVYVCFVQDLPSSYRMFHALLSCRTYSLVGSDSTAKQATKQPNHAKIEVINSSLMSYPVHFIVYIDYATLYMLIMLVHKLTLVTTTSG